MKPSTDRCISHERLSSTNSTDIKTATVPAGTSHVDLQLETTSARVTFDGTAPSATNGLVFLADQQPSFRPLGQGTTIKFASTAGTTSALNIAYYQ